MWLTSDATIETRYYSQHLDHFGYGSMSSKYFTQKLVVDYSYGPPNQELVNGSPILVFFGGEAHIESWVGGPGIGPGIVQLAAIHFRALVVYIEHRFYGESVPYGSIDLAMMDTEVRGCFTSAQALADFADVILSLKLNFSITNSPVIVMGGSYSGMLAAWFRLKYPHIAIGALASSAPVLNILEIPPEDQYCSIASRDYRETSHRCYDYISKSWGLIDKIAMQPGGLDILARTFRTCSPLFTANELKNYLAQMYRYMAQYNGRFSRINIICDEISHTSENDILEGISRVTFMISGQKIWNNITWAPRNFYPLDHASQKAWSWQVHTHWTWLSSNMTIQNG
ncbi:hypothetical protein RND81_10G232200 [Saponaria officinalis]|uniref:Uncharacterized protein n=1 Tax=Saponaria officinalis TaxID=3572 RepID=A0AAW1I7M6_SAPOF